MLHRVLEERAVEHVHVYVEAAAGDVGVEQSAEVADPLLAATTEAGGIIVVVSEMPSSACSYGSFATESADAAIPRLSRPCIGFAPGANVGPARKLASPAYGV
jgi:hypothetical protein